VSILVFDNTVPSHFARAGRLEVLRDLTAAYDCVTPSQVVSELLDGVVKYPALAKAVALEWVETVELVELDEVIAFARYKAELGGGDATNNGEAAVLGWVSVHGGVGIVDEQAATELADRDNLQVHGTLWLIANAVRSGELERVDAERMVDDLASSDMRLPVDGSGFFAWAYTEGLLP
jgi:predicted nucleic acid-binding protein